MLLGSPKPAMRPAPASRVTARTIARPYRSTRPARLMTRSSPQRRPAVRSGRARSRLSPCFNPLRTLRGVGGHDTDLDFVAMRFRVGTDGHHDGGIHRRGRLPQAARGRRRVLGPQNLDFDRHADRQARHGGRTQPHGSASRCRDRLRPAERSRSPRSVPRSRAR